jgi:cell division protein FtsL
MSSELQQLEQALQQPHRSSRGSVAMMIIAALALIGSLVYSATRLAPLERDIAKKKAQIASFDQRLALLKASEAQLQQQISTATAQLADLRHNIEQLYAVKVSAENTVFELKATALATGQNANGRPIYDFSVFINAAETTLQSIKQVTYLFDHATFRQREQTTVAVQDQFRVGYTGWGCLTKVTATVAYHSGERTTMDFNMCRSLGPMWQGQGCAEDDKVVKRVSKNPPAGTDCVRNWPATQQ